MRTAAHTQTLLDVATAPPDPPRTFVRRPALIQRLAEQTDAALALLIAPPGYGKTTLLTEWAEADERTFLWLSFAEQDIDIPKPAACNKWDRLPELIRTLRETHGSFVVVLDDTHWIERMSLCEVLQAALNELPSGSTIALASRTEPPLPIGRLRAHRTLVEVRIPQLAMTPDEALMLLNGESVDVAPEQAAALVGGTEGWPAAIYLAALSLRDDPGASVSFGGQSQAVRGFVRDEVLTCMPDELRSFAVHTSVLDDLNAAACDALLERRGSGELLEQLAGQTPLLERVDTISGGYRWHRLLRAALRTELALVPDVERRLHARASTWYRQRGDTDRAIDHATATGDADLAGEVLVEYVFGYLASGRTDLVHGWLSAFPLEMLRDHAPLALCASLTCLTSGDAAGAERCVAAAQAAYERGGPAAHPEGVAAGMALVRAMTTRQSLTEMGKAATRAGEHEPRDSQWQPLCLLLRAVSLHLSGDPEAADGLLEEASRLSGNVAPSIASLGLTQRAMIAMEKKDWDLAREMTDRAIVMIEEWELTKDPMSAIVYAAAAASRAHEGRADEAKRDRRRGDDLLVSLRDFLPWYEAQARILLAHASLWLADIVGARTRLAEASRFARKAPDAVTFAPWFDEAWAYMDEMAETRLSGPSALTIAELRILRFLPSHRSLREIATQLGVSANTVKTQAHAVYRKLDAASRSEAVQRALDVGLLGQQ